MKKEFLNPTYFTDYETDTLVLNIKYSRREVIQKCHNEIQENWSDQEIDRIYKSYVRPYDENLDETGHIHDEYRMYYIKEHLKYVHEAILDGVECMGYLYWGPIDVVSAGTGEMKKRYGFVYVDRFNDGHGTLERKLKDSYEEYKEIIETNGDSILHS